jgi:hypothetical protein
LVLGEVEETIYTVDEDDEDEEVKVSHGLVLNRPLSAKHFTDHQPKVGDVVRTR